MFRKGASALRRAMTGAPTSLRIRDDFAKGKAPGLVRNGAYVPAADALASLPEVLRGVMVYEVMRVFEGKPLYIDDHLERLRGSVAAQGWDEGVVERVRADIAQAVGVNHLAQQNLKVLVVKPVAEEGAATVDAYVYPVESFFPPKQFYEEGVKGLVIDHERADPQSKVLDMALKGRFAEAYGQGYYEVFLRDHRGDILEGSRSNVFCIKGGAVYTPPDEAVLLGVTRSHVLEVCAHRGIPVHYAPLTLPLLEASSGMFLSSTSNGPLPIRSLECGGGQVISYAPPLDDPTYHAIHSQFFSERPV
eukprot:TRINITY_DN28555_c0_g1_i1.p1 TRINITY_DN28555_c0_g1~~TRINITY_DN28555_c0_g1_i1.p1  ORF type:complete len:305 (+),score=93.72 TRINITY_DN28555_c0_g1_i1:28-942(+)